jgi:hypothetical protein
MELSGAKSLSAALEGTLAARKAAAREQLDSFWRALEYAFQEQLDAAASSLAEQAGRMLAAEREAAWAQGRRELAAALAEAARRLRRAENRAEWSAALLEAAALFCRRAILLVVRGEALEVADVLGFDAEQGSRLAGLRFPLSGAPAIAQAVENGEPVVALPSGAEISEPLSAVLGEEEAARAWLLPMGAQERAAAVLLVEGAEPELDLRGLELVAAMGGAARGGASWPPLETPAPARAPDQPPRRPPEWSQLSREEQELHLRAQRFARVQVAEMRLHKAQAVQDGRARRDLYNALKPEIEAGREAFRAQFLSASPSMVDYFHRELVRTLANEDAALLGKDYPGPLV